LASFIIAAYECLSTDAGFVLCDVVSEEADRAGYVQQLRDIQSQAVDPPQDVTSPVDGVLLVPQAAIVHVRFICHQHRHHHP